MSKKDPFTTAVSVRMEEELRDDLESLAARDERPLSNYTRKVLAEHVRVAREHGLLPAPQVEAAHVQQNRPAPSRTVRA